MIISPTSTRLDVVPARVDDPHLGVGHRDPAAGLRPRDDVVVVQQDAARAALGLAARLHDRGVGQRRDQGLGGARGHRCGAVKADPQAGEVARAEVRQPQQVGVHRRDAEEERDPLASEDVRHRGRFERREDHMGRPEHYPVQQQHVEARGVVQRCDVQHPLPVAQTHADAGVDPHPQHPAVVEQRPLGPAGGPGRVDDQRVVVRGDLDGGGASTAVACGGADVLVSLEGAQRQRLRGAGPPGKRLPRPDTGRDLRTEQQQPCLGVGGQVVDLRRGRARVDRHHDRAQAQTGVDGDDERVAVAGQQEHAVAVGGTADGRQLVDLAIQLGVGECHVAEPHGDAVGAAAGGAGEDTGEGGHRTSSRVSSATVGPTAIIGMSSSLPSFCQCLPSAVANRAVSSARVRPRASPSRAAKCGSTAPTAT